MRSEVAREAILKGLTRLRAFRRDQQFRTWLIHIAVQEARMHRRNVRNHEHGFTDEIRDSCEASIPE